MSTTLETEQGATWREFDTASQVIDFDELKIEIVADDHSDAPWESCDGFEHDVLRRGRDIPDAMDWREHSGRFSGRHGYDGVILLRFPAKATGYGTDAFLRARGCSKQAAFEAEKQNEKRTREQLAEWYSEGWQCYGVTVEYQGEHVDSCFGFYDDDAEDYGKREVVSNAIATLEGQGYEVRDIPAWVTKAEKRTLPGNVHWFDFGNQDGNRHEFKRDFKPLPLP